MKKAGGKQASGGLLLGLLLGMQTPGWGQQRYTGPNIPNEEARRLEPGHAEQDANAHTAGKEAPGLRISVRLYNYAGVSGGVLRGAEKQANRIFNAAGIDTTWVDCTATPVLAVSASAQPEEGTTHCFAPLSAGIVLRIVSRPTPASKAFRDAVFGFAEGSFVATVFYARVEDLAHDVYGNESETPLILGDVIAHEMGHLLLGTKSHSPSGIMCAKWDKDYLRLAFMGHQLFTPQQAGVIRAEVSRRNQVEVAADHKPERQERGALSQAVPIVESTPDSPLSMTLGVYNYAHL